MYDDFKLKKTSLVSMVYTKVVQRCKGWPFEPLAAGVAYIRVFIFY